jgi:hypothetical protein
MKLCNACGLRSAKRHVGDNRPLNAAPRTSSAPAGRPTPARFGTTQDTAQDHPAGISEVLTKHGIIDGGNSTAAPSATAATTAALAAAAAAQTAAAAVPSPAANGVLQDASSGPFPPAGKPALSNTVSGLPSSYTLVEHNARPMGMGSTEVDFQSTPPDQSPPPIPVSTLSAVPLSAVGSCCAPSAAPAAVAAGQGGAVEAGVSAATAALIYDMAAATPTAAPAPPPPHQIQLQPQLQLQPQSQPQPHAAMRMHQQHQGAVMQPVHPLPGPHNGGWAVAPHPMQATMPAAFPVVSQPQPQPSCAAYPAAQPQPSCAAYPAAIGTPFPPPQPMVQGATAIPVQAATAVTVGHAMAVPKPTPITTAAVISPMQSMATVEWK